MIINSHLVFHTAGACELRNAVIERLTVDPVGALGRIYYNTISNEYRFYNGTSWLGFATVTQLNTFVAALQAEIDNIEASLGTMVNSSGVFQGAVFTSANGTIWPVSPTSLTDALDTFADFTLAAIPVVLGDLNDVDVAGVADNSLLQFNSSTVKWEDSPIGPVSGVQAWDQALDELSTLPPVAADALPYGTAPGTYAFTPLTPFSRTLLDDVTASDWRISLGLASGGAGDIWVDAAGDTMIGILNMSNNLITNVAPPLSSTDAVNKAYVDALIAGLKWKNSVIAASTGAYMAVYSALAGTLTAVPPFSVFSIDGQTPGVGQRVLIKDQTAALQNGIYVVTDTGSVATPFVLTRADDFNDISEVNGAAVYVETGATQPETGWTVTSQVVAFNIDPIIWGQFSGAGSFVAGIGLSLTGNTFNVNLGAGIFEGPLDEVGIDLFDTTTGAIILTTNGVSRSTLAAAKLHLLLETSRGLAQGVSGLAISFLALTAAVVDSADSLMLFDASDSNNPKSTAVSSFIRTSSSISALADVDTTGAADGHALVFDGVNWVDQKIYHLHTQGAPLSTWIVTHDIGQLYCHVTVIDSLDQVILPQSITFTSANTLTVTFTSPTTGKVVVMGVA